MNHTNQSKECPVHGSLLPDEKCSCQPAQVGKDMMPRNAEKSKYEAKLRGEIRCLHRRLKDANRGAQRQSQINWSLACKNAEKDRELSQLRKELEAYKAANAKSEEDARHWTDEAATYCAEAEKLRSVYSQVLMILNDAAETLQYAQRNNLLVGHWAWGKAQRVLGEYAKLVAVFDAAKKGQAQ